MNASSFILRDGLMLGLCRSVLSMMIAKAIKNTVSTVLNCLMKLGLQTQYLCANLSMILSIF